VKISLTAGNIFGKLPIITTEANQFGKSGLSEQQRPDSKGKAILIFGRGRGDDRQWET
jgi:hypothetical protein